MPTKFPRLHLLPISNGQSKLVSQVSPARPLSAGWINCCVFLCSLLLPSSTLIVGTQSSPYSVTLLVNILAVPTKPCPNSCKRIETFRLENVQRFLLQTTTMCEMSGRLKSRHISKCPTQHPQRSPECDFSEFPEEWPVSTPYFCFLFSVAKYHPAACFEESLFTLQQKKTSFSDSFGWFSGETSEAVLLSTRVFHSTERTSRCFLLCHLPFFYSLSTKAESPLS